MNAVDSRTRSKVHLEAGARSRSEFTRLAASNILFLLAVYLGKATIAESAVLSSVVKILAVGALTAFVWAASRGQWQTKKSIEWPVVGLASLLLSFRLGATLFALVRLPAVRLVILSQYSPVWMNCMLNNTSRPSTLYLLLAIGISFLSDARFSPENFRVTAPGYIALILEAFASSVLEHTQGVLLPTLGPSMSTTLPTIGGLVFSAAMYTFSLFFPRPTFTEEVTPGFTMQLLTAAMLSVALLFSSPAMTKRLSYSPSAHEISFAFVVVLVSAGLFSVVPRLPTLGLTDGVVTGCLYYGIRLGKTRQTIAKSPYGSITHLARGYLKSILENPESRKIFYFLVLNMCYMGVQMLYGIWTNSLGLISDAIHMAFDCMAIGVGLIASVMARWAPNERFTYGYSRIETLSGFSNGVFLILISIFIVFEAVERLMNPPEMNTSQLLLVSTVGLGVNLFGMFAMGGHHHHGGHSHSHGHSHGHSDAPHSHPSTPSPTIDRHHGHSHSHSDDGHVVHDHDDHHGHSHGRESPLRVETDNKSSHSHSHSHSTPSHGHSHSHSGNDHADRGHGHGHDHHDSCGDLDHDHDHDHGHDKPHSHSHSHDMKSPITPNYNFERDEHFENHHASSHAPNLHNHAHVHDHGGHEGHSHNMRGVFLHVMADTLGSVGVIISTLLIQFYGWTGFDPIASLFIAILIAASVIPLVIDTGKVLMLDVDHRSSNIERALTELHQVDGLASFSAPRFWPKDDNNIIGSIHISVAPSAAGHDPSGPHSTMQGRYQHVERIIERVDSLLRSRISGLEELTIQVEGA
ncbi:cation efflux protein [Phanerochaete sordida]|uniref:Cation efflux protein n=1 Tax=Phanerochaete sordida TaxID=48140 RepID=A0A9P3G8A3_9APHY|nr:cation efflux protein [Phanerochaete sordida]